MILVLSILLGCGAGLLAGGRLRNLEKLRFKFWPAMLGLFAVQGLLRAALPEVARVPSALVVGSWCLCTGLLVGLTLVNARVPGMVFVTAGLALNLLVVAANGAMPLDARAATAIGASPEDVAVNTEAGFYRLADPQTRFFLLADVIPVPGFPGLRSVLSIGDVLLFFGAAVIVAAGMRASPG